VNDTELLALHRELVATPSPSGQEAALCALLAWRLAGQHVNVERIGDSLVASTGTPPYLCLCSHLDTVPAGAGWTRAPHQPVVEEGRVYGLGSNDAKASVAAMLAAFVRQGTGDRGPGTGGSDVGAGLVPARDSSRLDDSGRPQGPPLQKEQASRASRQSPAPGGTILAFVAGEEKGGLGAEVVVAELARRGLAPAAAVVGEPTGLDIVVAQKGLLILELRAHGTACHAAHARALGATNAIEVLARDLLALAALDLDAADPELGPITLEPTVIAGGSARNALPAEATAVLDVRTNPMPSPAEVVERVRAVVASEVKVLSERLRPCATAPTHSLVQAAQRARPEAALYGSRTLSDWVFFANADIPAIKVGPGRSERSHTVDEYVEEREILDGAAFYERLIKAWLQEVSQ
jgi:acetylornithine deacetylase